MIKIISKITATALATGQSRFEKNSSNSTFPIIKVPDPPSNDGITNSPSAGMKTKKHPAIIPPLDRGIVINQNAYILEQPRSSAASISEASRRSSAA